MGQTLTPAAIGGVVFRVLDGLWPGLPMKTFDDGMNHSTPRQWPFVPTLADVARGAVASAACAAAVRSAAR